MPLRSLFVDLNSFFASVEQQLDDSLRGRPVAVVPMLDVDTTAVLAASYPAKKLGIKTGTKVADAKRLCPDLICVKARHTAYIEFHHKVLAAAETVLPIAAVHSIDEFSCKLLGDEHLPAKAEHLARKIKEAIAARVGPCLTCSIGLAPNRFLAKVATDMQKPDGLVILTDEVLRERLLTLTPRDLPGIGPRMQDRLNRQGIYTMEHLLACDEKRMRELWQSLWGSFYYHALRGQDMAEKATTRRSISHQHVLSPEKRNAEDARAVCVRLLDKAAARARNLGYWARRLSLHIRYVNATQGPRDFTAHERFNECNDTLTLLDSLARLWDKRHPGTPLRVSVALDELTDAQGATRPLFAEDQKKEQISRAIDAINEKVGRAAVYPASMHTARKSAPARIAFKSIPDLNLPHVRETADHESREGPQPGDDKPTGSAPR